MPQPWYTHSGALGLSIGESLNHERTVQQLKTELDHVFGFKTSLKKSKSGFYLEGPGGQIAPLGDSGYSALLSPRDQEAICENFGLDAALIGLDPKTD
jgi:hypothetical protein